MAMAINPAAEMAQLRNQQTLAMGAPTGAAPGAPASPVAGAMPATAAAAPAAVAPDAQMAAAAQAAAMPGAAGDAGIAAQAVQPPPSTGKIVIQSLLKGAMTGVSVTLGLKSFGPMLMKVGFLKNIIGTFPAAAAAAGAAGKAGTGLLGFLSRIPLIGKIFPMTAKAGIQGFLITAAIGAAVGGIVGAVTGIGKAKKAQAEYADAVAKAQAAAQQQMPPVGNPNVPDPAAAEPPKAKAKVAAHKPRFKSWVVARSGSHLGGAQKFGSYTTKGESMAALCKRFHTTPEEIRELNPSITGDSVPAGTKLKLARKVVPTAQFYRG